jgi:hypothetical protein
MLVVAAVVEIALVGQVDLVAVVLVAATQEQQEQPIWVAVAVVEAILRTQVLLAVQVSLFLNTQCQEQAH